jgi:hypothetical protein
MRYFFEFLKRYVSDWFAILSGPLALPFTVYGVYSSNTAYNRALFTALLVSGLILSSFRVWKKEYDRTLHAEFPLVQYPGGAVEFVVEQNERMPTRYIAVQNLTITNRSRDKSLSIHIHLQITRKPAQLMFSPESKDLRDWLELANLQQVPHSNQLMFPLSIPPRSSVGGHAVFLLSNMGLKSSGSKELWMSGSSPLKNSLAERSGRFR